MVGAKRRLADRQHPLILFSCTFQARQAVGFSLRAGGRTPPLGHPPEARGHQQITKAATQLWDLDRRYLAQPRRILQVRDTALVLADHAINVVHRGDDGFWRYAISLLDLEKTTATKQR